jgi:hypothetical protein
MGDLVHLSTTHPTTTGGSFAPRVECDSVPTILLEDKSLEQPAEKVVLVLASLDVC